MDTNNISLYNNNLLKNIKSKYILKQIFDHINTNIKLRIIRYNNKIQTKIDIDINDYIEEYLKIEIEIIPKKLISKNINKNYFINIKFMVLKPHCHIYFNDDTIETYRTYLKPKDNVTKIKIILDKEFDYFQKLFYKCDCIEKIKFIKCNREDINDTSYMFYFCRVIKEINLLNININNVINMSHMFEGCVQLRKLFMNEFNNNEIDKSEMFSGCGIKQITKN